MAKKVIVHSLYREPVVKVGQVPARDHNGVAVMVPTMRAFFEYRCYMTPEEANFLVESKENVKARNAGKAVYFFPAGFPVQVDENHEGPLAPAVSAEALSTSGDPSQAIAAKEQLAEAEAELQLQEKGAREKGQDSPMARQLGTKARGAGAPVAAP